MSDSSPSPRRRRWLIVLILVAAVATYLLWPRGASLLSGLSRAPLGSCLADGTQLGIWRSEFAGYGCNAVIATGGERGLQVSPKASQKPDETHAALFVGPTFGGDLSFKCGVRNLAQLRTGSSPNPWEVGWVVWSYQDKAHFYYFVLKPNGWELGKLDPAYKGGQRFLASGDDPLVTLGLRHEVQVEQHGATLKVAVDGKDLTTFTDRERPYVGGRVGVYCEDAAVQFDGLEAQ